MSILLADDASAEEVRRQGWLARRREIVTSTDVPVLFGQGYSGTSPALLFAQKRGQAPEFEPGLRMKIGRLMEPVIRAVYEEVTGHQITKADPYSLHVSDKYPWLGASLDGFDPEIGVHVEMKNHASYMTDESDIPGGWYLQIQTQLLVLERSKARLAVLVAGSDLKIFDIEANPEIQAEIVKRSREFIERVREGRVPPPVSPEDSDAYKYIYQPNGETVVLEDLDIQGDGAVRDTLKQQVKQLEEQIAMIEGRVKYALGDNEVGVLPDGGSWSWKPDKNGRRSLRYKGPRG